MPEGDSIHKLARSLRAELEGQVLTDARSSGQRLDSLVGRPVDDVFALGKHLFVVVGARVLRTHLGMHGSWRRQRPESARPGAAWRVSAELATGRCTFRCLHAREAEVLDLHGQRMRAWLRRLGPDLLRGPLDLEQVVHRARRLLAPETPLMDLLLDQRVAAGIGNVYKCETLFLHGRDPRTPMAALTDTEIAELFSTAATLLKGNLHTGPRRTRGLPAPATTHLREPEVAHYWVYGRGDEPCARGCGATVRFARQGRHRRATWWCPRCQPCGARDAAE